MATANSVAGNCPENNSSSSDAVLDVIRRKLGKVQANIESNYKSVIQGILPGKRKTSQTSRPSSLYDTEAVWHPYPEHIEMASLKQRGTGRGHQFVACQLTNPTWCDKCGDFIWGLYKQCQRCTTDPLAYLCALVALGSHFTRREESAEAAESSRAGLRPGDTAVRKRDSVTEPGRQLNNGVWEINEERPCLRCCLTQFRLEWRRGQFLSGEPSQTGQRDQRSYLPLGTESDKIPSGDKLRATAHGYTWLGRLSLTVLPPIVSVSLSAVNLERRYEQSEETGGAWQQAGMEDSGYYSHRSSEFKFSSATGSTGRIPAPDDIFKLTFSDLNSPRYRYFRYGFTDEEDFEEFKQDLKNFRRLKREAREEYQSEEEVREETGGDECTRRGHRRDKRNSREWPGNLRDENSREQTAPKEEPLGERSQVRRSVSLRGAA
ncbi:hypothetical protein BaRGS_00005288, partial [Batillaria attramentaria]